MNKKRLICLFLSAVFMLLCLQGCGPESKPPEETTLVQTTAAVTEPPEEILRYLIKDGVCEYSIVYEKDSENAKDAARKLMQVIQVKYKLLLKASDAGSVAYDANAKEIYIGSTGFAESIEAAKNLKVKRSYCITEVGNKFVFVADDDRLLMEAVEYYVSDVLPDCVSFNPSNGKPSVRLPSCIVKNASGSGALHSSISIGDVDLGRYRIVYEEESEKLIEEYAGALRDAVSRAYGVQLSMVGDQSSEETDYEILIGNTNRAASAEFAERQEVGSLEYHLSAQGKKYLIVGGGYFSVKCGVQRFINTYLYSLSDEIQIPLGTVIKKNDFVGTVAHAEGSALRLMTLNVMSEVYAEQYYGDDPPTPPERIEILMALLEAYSPDLVGLQEMTPWWQETFAKYLDPDEWGIFSATTKDLTQAVLYHKSTVTLLESQILDYYPGTQFGRAWMVFGKFRVNASGKECLFSTTHWHPTDDAVKDLEAAALAETVVRLRKENEGLPIFCTGDFNTRYGTERYQSFLTATGMQDTFDLAKAAGKTVNEVNGNGTPGMKRGDSPYTTNVDHIFCDPGITVGRYESVLENQITNLTDHAPRYADVFW